jgi:transglutaminase-like putative cysteine protease
VLRADVLQTPLIGIASTRRRDFEQAGGRTGQPTRLGRLGLAAAEKVMRLRIGYELRYQFPQPTPVIVMLNVHDSRVCDLERPDDIVIEPAVPISRYRDVFANQCSRILAPAGAMRISTDTVVRNTELPDLVAPGATQVSIEDLPDDTLVFLIASRFCDSDRLLDLAWTLFGRSTPGWTRVQAVCDFVHAHIAFGYEHARVTRSASEAYQERRGVCRDYAHLAIAFCRALNIPARYCTGYLGDIGVPADPAPMDFSAWYEVFLDGRWFTFDARHNHPRIGRIVIARGRDAADVAISTAFGPARLARFKVITDQLRQVEQDTRLKEAA